MSASARDVVAAGTSADLERIGEAATGPAGLMEMAHFYIGEVLRKELGHRAQKSVRLVIGNPLIMKEMVKHVPDGASYAPYGNAQASAVAAQLDEKVVAVLTTAAE